VSDARKPAKRGPSESAVMPRGRPKGSIADLAAIARRALDNGAWGVEQLKKIVIYGKRDADKIRALELLFDRGYGKSVDVQVLAHITENSNDPTQLAAISANALEMLSRALVARGGPALPAGEVVDVTPEPAPAALPADEPTDT
jgi:hypothetical protein